MSDKPVTAPDLLARKGGEKIVMVTAYDATFAAIFDAARLDILLVGDSLGMVVQGHADTLRVTLNQMIYHTANVSRVARRAQVVADMPFMTYQASRADAVRSAGRLVQRGGAAAVKLEGGETVATRVAAIVASGIPVMGHIGLTPQSVHQLGGYKVQGRERAAQARLLRDAKALERAGCYSLVLESIPAELAAEITAQVGIPTIGIGAGPDCDGQVLVCYDLLGMNPGFQPKFVKAYDNLSARISAAVAAFSDEVRSGAFPDRDHSFHAPAPVLDSRNDRNEPRAVEA